MLDSFIKQLSSDIELNTPPLPNEKGVYVLYFQPNIYVHIIPYKEGYSFFADVIPCPKENQDSIFEKILLGNLFGQGTNGSILALNEEGTQIILAYHNPERTDYRFFHDKLEDFLNTVEFWQEEAVNLPRK